MKDRFVAKRYINLLLILLVTLAYTVVISLYHERFLDELLISLLLDVIFFALFLFVLESNRMQKQISQNRETTFRKILFGYMVCCFIATVGSFFPEFLKPALLIPIFMAAYGTEEIAMCVGIFLNMAMCLALGSGTQEFILYCMMTLFGCMLAKAIENRKLQFWYELIIFCVSAVLPGMFYYLTYREPKMSLFLWGAAEGLLVDVVLLVCYPRIAEVKQTEIVDTLEDILYDSYPMNRELLKFSRADYNHAKRVSKVSAKCAGIVGADEKICAAAGFYYRIGILDGAAIAENGIRIAQRECFPEEIIRIISEYNGENALPSNIESAIVHMVDGLIKKLEVLDSQTMSSEWNQDMVIYQTLNDFSAQGLYDKSGLSMNMFLKIREYLVNEEELL